MDNLFGEIQPDVWPPDDVLYEVRRVVRTQRPLSGLKLSTPGRADCASHLGKRNVRILEHSGPGVEATIPDVLDYYRLEALPRHRCVSLRTKPDMNEKTPIEWGLATGSRPSRRRGPASR